MVVVVVLAGFKPSSSEKGESFSRRVPGRVERDVVARFQKTLHAENARTPARTHAHEKKLKQVSRV